MSLKTLIRNQVIKIDDHQWGNKEIKTFEGHNKDVHLDKRTNFPIDGKLQHVVIKISLNSDRQPKITIDNKTSGNIPPKLKKEINDALKNEENLLLFFFDIATVINNYESKLESESKCIEVFDRVAKNFGLELSGEEIFHLNQYFEATYKDPDNNKYYRMQLTKKALKLGEKSGAYLDYFKI